MCTFACWGCRFGHRFELPLLAQSVLMVSAMLYMMHACVEGCYKASAKKVRIYGEANSTHSHPKSGYLLNFLLPVPVPRPFCRGLATSRALNHTHAGSPFGALAGPAR